MKKKCLNCNKEFYIPPSRRKAKYCSYACMYKCIGKIMSESWAKKKPRIIKKCIICQKKISLSPIHSKSQGTYCSRKCMAIGYKTKLLNENNPNWKGGIANKKFLCKKCGKKFFTYPTKNRKYCSCKCFFSDCNKTDFNSKIRSGNQYKEWRRAVFERDNYVCQNCKEGSRRLQADHILPFAYFPELRFDVENGRTLCFDCHKKTDTHSGKCISKYQNSLFGINRSRL